MPTTYTRRFTIEGVKPKYNRAQTAMAIAVKLPASVTYAAGTVLCEVKGKNEVQSLVIDATGGTFTTTFSGQTTSAVAYNASAATFKAALEALSTIGTGNVSVIKNLTRMTITHSSGTDAGTFALAITVDGVTRYTASVAWNVSAADLTTAIEACDNVGTGGCTATGSAGGPYTLTFLPTLSQVDGGLSVKVVNDDTNDGGVWEGGITLAVLANSAYQVTFINDLGYQNVAAMTTTAASLTGGAGTATVATVTAGVAATSGTWKQWTSSATDGSQTGPCAILEYACATDSSGNITLGTAEGGGSNDETVQNAPAWVRGDFACEDVPTMTMAMLDLFGGRMIHGTTYSNGVFTLP